MINEYEITQKEYNEQTLEFMEAVNRLGFLEEVLTELDLSDDYFDQLVEFARG